MYTLAVDVPTLGRLLDPSWMVTGAVPARLKLMRVKPDSQFDSVSAARSVHAPTGIGADAVAGRASAVSAALVTTNVRAGVGAASDWVTCLRT